MPENDASENNASEKASSEKAADEKAGAKAATPVATSVAAPITNLEGSIFSTSSYMTLPDISMKTGAAIVNYSILVPPGRNGLTPAVFLHYNSSKKDGVAGVGWGLNTDSIKRSTKYGVCYTCTSFTMNDEELVPININASGYGTYRPEKEQTFSTIEYHSTNSWTVTFKNGLEYTYGTSAASKQTNAYGTFQWFLETIKDTNNNTISYTYTEDQGQVYLSTIAYSNYYTISFFYKDRLDKIESYVSNSKVKTANKLKTIAIEGNNHTIPIRAYDLDYNESFNTARTLLENIRIFGSDYILDSNHEISSGSSLPPTQITYNKELTAFTIAPESLTNTLSKGQGYSDTYNYPVITGDWNGDGKEDIGRVGPSGIIFYVSTGTGWQLMTTLDDLDPSQGFANNNEYPIITGDWNGDGRTDIARAGDANVWFYVSTGSGFQLFSTLNDLCKGQGYTNFNDYPIFTGDFNSDGRTDVGRVAQDSVAFFVSTGNGFQPYNGINGLAKDQGYSTYFEYPLVTGDFKGDGRTGIGRVSDSGVVFYSPGGAASDLVSKITSSTGNETWITYTPSSAYANTLLPFVLQTVSQITTNDGLGNLSATSWSYSGGLYDFVEREIRNFGTATKTNPDGTKEITEFHQDKFLDGQVKKTEFRDPAGNLLTRVIYTWVSSPYNSASSFIFLESKAETRYENGKTLVSQENYNWDIGHGSLLTKTHLASTGSGLTEDIITAYEYGYYGTGLTYPLRTTAETLSGSTSGVARQTLYGYQTGTGNLLSETAVNIAGPDPVTIYGHDNYGNINSITDPMNNVTYYDYDTRTHSYPVKITKPVTGIYPHITEYPSIDFRYGKPLTFKNENSNITTYEYDVFGRVVRILYPDTGEEGYVYIDTFTGSLPRSITKRIRDGAASFIDTITYLDGFGRTVQTVEPSISNSFAVSLFTFDNMGRPASPGGLLSIQATPSYIRILHPSPQTRPMLANGFPPPGPGTIMMPCPGSPVHKNPGMKRPGSAMSF
ncbi:MAG: toxin TcdB middle/N-terminal domain-containing protein [Desulfobacula sp.]